MRFIVEAACGCKKGKIRKNNEDNFYFAGKCLEKENNGLKYPVYTEDNLQNGFMVSVFDGMGGENFGEYASFAAATQMQKMERAAKDFFVPERKYLLELTEQLNTAVIKAQQEMCTARMGTTMALLYFSGRHVYCCNLGDSRSYRLRNGEFLQLSEDHVERFPKAEHKKAHLTGYLGINTEERLLEPYIAKGELREGDLYLICSDGLTDMLSNFEISDILLRSEDVEDCVRMLVRTAVQRGGCDDITVIVCVIK